MPPPKVKVIRVSNVVVGSSLPYLAANTARVDPSGSDITVVFGNLTNPFLTVQGAITAIEALQVIPDHPVIIIPRGYNYYDHDDITTSLASIIFQGPSENDSVENLILTASQVELIFNNCTSSNITANCPSGLYLKIDLSGEIAGNVTNSSGRIKIISSGGGLVGGTISCPGFNIELQGVNWAREDETVTIDSAGSDVIATQCVLGDTTAQNVTMNDSRFKIGATLNISGTITYVDTLLTGTIANHVANGSTVDQLRNALIAARLMKAS
jgi:hypothetical protein